MVNLAAALLKAMDWSVSRSSRKKVSKHEQATNLPRLDVKDRLNWQVSQLVSMGLKKRYRVLASRLAVLIFSAQFPLSCAKRMSQIVEWFKRGTGRRENKKKRSLRQTDRGVVKRKEKSY